jgi:class 3 adenylate cyclase
MDLGGWLRSLGLEQYEAIFRENAIDDTVLPSLTAEDLKDLGVNIVGHRRKLLNAIAALRADASAKTPPPDALPPTDRTATDSVGLSEMRRRDRAPLRRLCGEISDGVLVYFGYPEAHEDDAERAVRAGLEPIAAVTGLKTRASLQTRVGIATGLVVVGDLIGSGDTQERGIVGETPNLAARLQGIAEPNMVVIAEGTRRLLGKRAAWHGRSAYGTSRLSRRDQRAAAHSDPVRLRQNLLQHERVRVDHAVLQKVQREHAQLMILVPIARQLAAAGEKHAKSLTPFHCSTTLSSSWISRRNCSLCR